MDATPNLYRMLPAGTRSMAGCALRRVSDVRSECETVALLVAGGLLVVGHIVVLFRLLSVFLFVCVWSRLRSHFLPGVVSV